MLDSATSIDVADRMHRLIEEGFARNDRAIIDELVAPDCIEHQRGHGQGVAGVHGFVSRLHGWLSDLEFRIEDLAVVGDRVWLRMRVAGIDTGPINGLAPTGKRVSVDVFDLARIEDGRVAEHWGVADQLGLLRQLGHDPGLATPDAVGPSAGHASTARGEGD
jgi:predicted ester cyclase